MRSRGGSRACEAAADPALGAAMAACSRLCY
jgi:hypothetical protein